MVPTSGISVSAVPISGIKASVVPTINYTTQKYLINVGQDSHVNNIIGKKGLQSSTRGEQSILNSNNSTSTNLSSRTVSVNLNPPLVGILPLLREFSTFESIAVLGSTKRSEKLKNYMKTRAKGNKTFQGKGACETEA
jgi:hypothetical protein